MNNLAWLVDQLTQAEANSELVHIINHIPPGNPDCLGAWGREFSEIVDRYKGLQSSGSQPIVTFINFLPAAFSPILFFQKIINSNVDRIPSPSLHRLNLLCFIHTKIYIFCVKSCIISFCVSFFTLNCFLYEEIVNNKSDHKGRTLGKFLSLHFKVTWGRVIFDSNGTVVTTNCN